MAIPSSNHHTQSLLDACADGDLNRLRTLLSNQDASAEALSEVDSAGRLKPHRILNLRNLVEQAAKSGHAALVGHLFAFGRQHSVNTDNLIDRDTILAALATSRIDVLDEFVKIQPSCVNLVLGYSGDPLARAINGPHLSFADDTNPEDRIPVVKYLLEHGADPNQYICGFFKPGFHLHTATARNKPIGMIRLLLEHGAQVKETGALVAAAANGRLNVMELLVANGADVNEPLTKDIFRDVDRQKVQARAEEKPIEAARRLNQEAAVEWLRSHGAE